MATKTTTKMTKEEQDIIEAIKTLENYGMVSWGHGTKWLSCHMSINLQKQKGGYCVCVDTGCEDEFFFNNNTYFASQFKLNKK